MNQKGFFSPIFIIIPAVLLIVGFLAFQKMTVKTPPSSSPEPQASISTMPSATAIPSIKAALKAPTASVIKTSSSPTASPSQAASPSTQANSDPIPGVYKLDVGNSNVNVPLGQVYYVSARLTDSNGKTIKDQTDFDFQWVLENTVPNHSDYTCYTAFLVDSAGNDFGGQISSPLPKNYGKFWAHDSKPVSSCPDTIVGGSSKVNVTVTKKSTGSQVVQGSITATIVAKN